MTSIQERSAFLDYWVKDVPEQWRAAARWRADKDLLLGMERGPLRAAADAWQARGALAEKQDGSAGYIVQEIEYGSEHGWPLETHQRLEAMAAAWKRRAALSTAKSGGGATPEGGGE